MAAQYKTGMSVFSQPAGTGKTRTIMSFIYMRAVLHSGPVHFVVRFVNKQLQDQDSAAYDILNAILPSNAKLERRVGYKDWLSEGRVQILDEADHFLLDGAGLDGQLHKHLSVFGVTATPLKSKSECLE